MSKVHKIRRDLVFRPSIHTVKTKRRTGSRLILLAIFAAVALLLYCTLAIRSGRANPGFRDAAANIAEGAITVRTMELPVVSAVNDLPAAVEAVPDSQPVNIGLEPSNHHHDAAFLSARELIEYEHLESYRDNCCICGQPAGDPGTILIDRREDNNGDYNRRIVSVPELPDSLAMLAEEYHCLLLYNELSSPDAGDYCIAQLVFYEHDLVIDTLLCSLAKDSVPDSQRLITFETRYLSPSDKPGHFMSIGRVYADGQSSAAYHEQEDLDTEGSTSAIQLNQCTPTSYTPTADHISQVLSALS